MMEMLGKAVIELATATEVKPAICKKVLGTLPEVATKEAKGIGKLNTPGLYMLSTTTRRRWPKGPRNARPAGSLPERVGVGMATIAGTAIAFRRTSMCRGLWVGVGMAKMAGTATTFRQGSQGAKRNGLQCASAAREHRRTPSSSDEGAVLQVLNGWWCLAQEVFLHAAS